MLEKERNKTHKNQLDRGNSKARKQANKSTSIGFLLNGDKSFTILLPLQFIDSQHKDSICI